MEIPLGLLSLKAWKCLLLRGMAGRQDKGLAVLPLCPMSFLGTLSVPALLTPSAPHSRLGVGPVKIKQQKGSFSKGYFHIKCLPPVLSHWGESCS